MKIILVGVSCVGKSTVGKMLADDLGYKFFDFDSEIEKYFDKPISIIKNAFFTAYSFREKARVILLKILQENDDDFVIAMPPSGLMDYYWKIIKKDDSLVTIALRDRAKNILKRIRFYDDYSKPIKMELTPKMEEYYLREISLDMEYFGRTHKRAKIKMYINGKSPLQVVDDLKKLLFEEK